MSNFAKPDKCECGAAVSFYGKGARGWECGRRDSYDKLRESWVTMEVCPIPKLVLEVRAENIRLRNTISQLTEQIHELDAELDALKQLQGPANG
jgi:hypothetical protein